MQNTIEGAIREMMEIISEKIPDAHKKFPVDLYLVGGVAVYYYTASRFSKDVDAIISRKVEIPPLLSVMWVNKEKNELSELSYDHQYTSSLGILHEDYASRAYLKYTIDEKLNVYVLSAEDLVISKLARFGEQDQDDIRRLIQNDLVNKDNLEKWAKEAVNDAIGIRIKTLEINLDLALGMFEE